MKSGNTTSCGCYHKECVGNMSRKHGLRSHKLYVTWSSIKARCYNKKDPAYKDYGSRGITICDEWRNNPKAFIEYALALPNAMKQELTIDRIRNNEGYKPGNLRWTDGHTQAVNQRAQKNNKSGFKGIYHVKSNVNKRWYAYIGVNGKKKSLGYYHTIKEALEARNQYIIDNNLPEYKIQLIV